MEEGFVKKLMTSIKCGACGRCYQVDDISTLGHQQDLWFLGAFCTVCHARCLVVAVVKEDRMPEFITDLAETELSKFRDMGRITADEMLDMHNFLENFDGNFSRLH